MTTTRRVRGKRALAPRSLTFDQAWELRSGPDIVESGEFVDDAERRDAYAADVERFDHRKGFAGRRSWAFWHFRVPHLEADNGDPIDLEDYGVTVGVCYLGAGRYHGHDPDECAATLVGYAMAEARERRLAERRLAYLVRFGMLYDGEAAEILEAGGRAAAVLEATLSRPGRA